MKKRELDLDFVENKYLVNGYTNENSYTIVCIDRSGLSNSFLYSGVATKKQAIKLANLEAVKFLECSKEFSVEVFYKGYSVYRRYYYCKELLGGSIQDIGKNRGYYINVKRFIKQVNKAKGDI